MNRDGKLERIPPLRVQVENKSGSGLSEKGELSITVHLNPNCLDKSIFMYKIQCYNNFVERGVKIGNCVVISPYNLYGN